MKPMQFKSFLFLLLCAVSIMFTISCTANASDDSLTESQTFAPTDLSTTSTVSQEESRQLSENPDVINEGEYTAIIGYTYEVCTGDSTGKCQECWKSTNLKVINSDAGVLFHLYYVNGSNQQLLLTDPCSYRQVRYTLNQQKRAPKRLQI